jgi:serine/threonine protein kinase
MGVAEDEENLYIVQEYVKGGSLSKVLSSPKELSWITRIRYESNKVNKREKYE